MDVEITLPPKIKNSRYLRGIITPAYKTIIILINIIHLNLSYKINYLNEFFINI